MCTTPGENTCHSSWLGFSSIDWPVTEDVDDALAEASANFAFNRAAAAARLCARIASVSLDCGLEPCSVESADGPFDSASESPFVAEAFVAKSEPPLADDEFVTEAFEAEVFAVTTDMLESPEFVATAMVVEPPLADDESVTEAFEAEVFTVTTDMLESPFVAEAEVFAVTTDMLESEEFVATVMAVTAELVLKPLSPVVVGSSSVASALSAVEERLAAPLDELDELEAVNVVVVEEAVFVPVGVVVVSVDVGVVVVPVVTVVVVLVTVEAVVVVVVVVTVVMVGRCNTLFRHCSSVCVVSSFFKSSRWPVSISMKPGSARRASQSPDLRPQTTSLYGETLSLREYTELALRTFTPKGSITCHSEIRSPWMLELTRPIVSLPWGPKVDESEPATQGSARANTPTVATDAAMPRAPRHRFEFCAVC